MNLYFGNIERDFPFLIFLLYHNLIIDYRINGQIIWFSLGNHYAANVLVYRNTLNILIYNHNLVYDQS